MPQSPSGARRVRESAAGESPGASTRAEVVLAAASAALLEDPHWAQNEEQSRAPARNTSDIITVVDAAGTVQYVSPATARVWGYTPEQRLGKSIFDLIHPDDVARVQRFYARQAQVPGMSPPIAMRLRGADGSWRHIEAVGINLLDNPNVGGIVITSRDITERTRAEEALRTSIGRLRTIFEAVPIGMIDVDAAGRIVRSNRAYQEMLGYTEDELRRITFADSVHPDDRAEGLRLLGELREGKRDRYRWEARHYRRDGHLIWTHLTAAAIRDTGGALQYTVTMVEDITERKRAERQSAAFSVLGQQLSAAMTPETAARIIAAVADDLLGWDAFFLVLYSAADGTLRAVLNLDVIDGRRTEVPPARFDRTPGPVIRRAIAEGGQLLLRDEPSPLFADLRPFGDIERPSASLMFVPIRRGAATIGVLSIQSYTPRAYAAADLALLQALADQCAGALERLRAEEALRASEARHRAVLDTAFDGIITATAEGTILSFNHGAEQIFGYIAEEVIGQPLALLMPEQARPPHLAGTRPYVEADELGRMLELTAQRKDGTTFPIELSIAESGGDKEQLFTGIVRDITARKRAEEALRQSEERLRTIVTNVPVVLFALDREGVFTLSEGKGLEVLGLQPDEVVGRSVFEVYREAPQVLGDVRRALAGEAFAGIVDMAGVVFEVSYVPLRDEDGEVAGIIGVASDITGRKQAEKQLAHQASHDPLTNLANRAFFAERLAQALARAVQYQGTFAVLFLDLDRFKFVNDRLGHAVGDHLLVAVAGRLQRCVRPGDIVARRGGDEFTILLENVTGERDALGIAERIIQALEMPFQLSSHEVFITTSIGIVLGTPEYQEPNEVLHDADIAMYWAKAKGKARYEVFDPSMGAIALARLELESDLRYAIERGEFVLRYQPKVDLATGRVVEVEALVRWEHPQRGLLLPAEFVAVAEETGLIRSIGRWVLEEACREVRTWQERYPGDLPLTLSVNLSAREFQDPEMVEEIARALRASGLNARDLSLEITESVVMADAEVSVAMLEKLKDSGVHLAIDDFGTGYSSLSYLKRLPLDMLKIDRSFVEGLGHSPEDTAIVGAVITLAHLLGLQVTAEGVTTEEQVVELRALGCELGQGLYFAEPLPADAVEALLTRAYPLPALPVG